MCTTYSKYLSGFLVLALVGIGFAVNPPGQPLGTVNAATHYSLSFIVTNINENCRFYRMVEIR